MTAAAMPSPPMKGPSTRYLTASVLFHAAVVVIMILGLPFLTPVTPPQIIDAITVEVVKDAEKAETTETNRPPQAAPQKTPPPQRGAKPPERDAPQVIEKPEPKPEKPEPVIDSFAAPTPKKRPPPPKKAAPEAPQEDQDEAFRSVLRNLTPDEPVPAADQAKDEPGDTPSPRIPLGQRLTISEQDALRRQLGLCWNLMAGARYAEDLVVDIRLTLSRDGTVQTAKVKDTLRYQGDTFFRAAADSALRAVRNPACNPLPLPASKYEQWKVMTVTFDPRAML